MKKQTKTALCGVGILSAMLSANLAKSQMIADTLGYYQHTPSSITILALAGATALLTLANLVKLNLKP